MIKVIKDIDLFDKVSDYDVILIGANTMCSLSQGFARKVMLNYPYVQERNMETRYGDKEKLGTILECKEEGSPFFVLLYINEGNYRPDLKTDFLSYESLDKCMKIVNILYRGKRIASTLLGTSRFDGNGDKEKVLEILARNSNNIELYIYDYHQKSKKEELKETRLRELEIKKKDRKAYYEEVSRRKKEADERFRKNGHARY